MPFSFTPGQEQTAAPVVTQQNNGVPVLVVPTIPNIAVGGGAQVEENISPFAYRNRNKSKFGVYFQSAIFLVFGCAFITTIGLLVYIVILKADIKSKAEALATKEETFPVLELSDIQKLSNRLKIVNKVFKEHASVRSAFEILEKSVENPVTYTKFTLTKNKIKKGYSLDVTGEAANYHVVYQQIEILRRKPYSDYLSNLVPSNIALDKTGVISFKLVSDVSIEGVIPSSMKLATSTAEDGDLLDQSVINSTTTGSALVGTPQ